MERTSAYYAGVTAGRTDANDDSLLHAINPPADYTDAQRDDFVFGYLAGQRAQWSDNLIRELARALGEE